MIRGLLLVAAVFTGDTWGHAGTSIWATRGCPGEFEVVLADGGRRAE